MFSAWDSSTRLINIPTRRRQVCETVRDGAWAADVCRCADRRLGLSTAARPRRRRLYRPQHQIGAVSQSLHNKSLNHRCSCHHNTHWFTRSHVHLSSFTLLWSFVHPDQWPRYAAFNQLISNLFDAVESILKDWVSWPLDVTFVSKSEDLFVCFLAYFFSAFFTKNN